MTEATPTLQQLTDRLIEFRDEREWRQFHSLKNLILSLNLEAAELLELTQWSEDAAFELASRDNDTHQQIREECADVLNYLLLIAERCEFDLSEAAAEKITKNAIKYPAEKSRDYRDSKYGVCLVRLKPFAFLFNLITFVRQIDSVASKF